LTLYSNQYFISPSVGIILYTWEFGRNEKKYEKPRASSTPYLHQAKSFTSLLHCSCHDSGFFYAFWIQVYLFHSLSLILSLSLPHSLSSHVKHSFIFNSHNYLECRTAASHQAVAVIVVVVMVVFGGRRWRW